MCDNLTPEQAEICQFARNGHNLLITGQAGTGKSRVVSAIRDDCKKRGLKVDVVCASGIACQVYPPGIASTVHSFYGLGVADLPSEKLVYRAISDTRVCERIRKVDVVIWDEASMSSARMLELVNSLHHSLAGENMSPFGGKQVIIVGEFLQLRPVPNAFDPGEFMFKSKLFEIAFPHRFQLTKVLRQSDNNKLFLSALSDVRLGACSKATALFIKQLSRELSPQLNLATTHIFFKRNGALLYNRLKLGELDGNLVRCEATFEGKGDKVNWPGEKSLCLKSNCKVMLIWNKSGQLKNGSMGVFKRSVDDDKLVVNFEKVGSVCIERVTWVQRNRQGEVIGSVHQFPIVLGYAVTCHKSQGLELPAVVVHCSKEFVPGLAYVAMSRVRSAESLQVIGFNQNQLIPADPEVIHQCSTDTGEIDPTLQCCTRRSIADDGVFEVSDRFQPDDATNVAEYQFPIEVSDGMVSAYFEREDTDVNASVAQVFQQMENHESELSSPPQEGLDTRSILTNLKVVTPYSDFSRMVNEQIAMLLQERFSENVKAFINIIWFQSFVAMESHITENLDDLDTKVTRGGFTTATGKLHVLFASPEFTQYLLCLFNASTCTTAQRSIGVELGTSVYFKFLEHLLRISTKEYQQEVAEFDVENMSSAGRAKVRHVGAWAIRKVLEKSRRYVRGNIYTENAETMASVRRHHSTCELIEESLIGSVAVLEQESQHKDTLQVTETRQYRERGLIHVEDAVYRFFMSLENSRVRLLNDQMLRKEGANMVEVAYEKLTQNEELKLKWQECFSSKDGEDRKELIEALLISVIERYLHMGTAQYLRDFRRSFELEKSAELRKRVLQRQKKNQEKTDSVPFKDIIKDRSEGKVNSHGRLTHFLEKYNDPNVFSRVYLKSQLISLCEAYEVPFRRSDTKKALVTALLEAIRRERSVPFTAAVDDRRFQIVQTVNDESHGSVRIRLRLTDA